MKKLTKYQYKDFDVVIQTDGYNLEDVDGLFFYYTYIALTIFDLNGVIVYHKIDNVTNWRIKSAKGFAEEWIDVQTQS